MRRVPRVLASPPTSRVRSIAGVVALALLVALAGCDGLVPRQGSPATEGFTPAPVPTDTGLPAEFSTAAGVAPDRLGAAHEAVVRNESYTLYSNRTVRYANGSLRSQLVVRVRLAENRTYLADVRTAGGAAPVLLGEPPARATFWSNGTLYLRAFTRGNATTYNRFEPPEPNIGTWRYWTTTVPFGGENAEPQVYYAAVFASIPTETVGRDRADGAVTYRLSGDRARASAFDNGVTDVDRVRLAAEVRQDGLVRTLSLTYAGRADGEPVRVHWTVRYRAVGETTVDRPPWFEKAVG